MLSSPCHLLRIQPATHFTHSEVCQSSFLRFSLPVAQALCHLLTRFFLTSQPLAFCLSLSLTFLHHWHKNSPIKWPKKGHGIPMIGTVLTATIARRIRPTPLRCPSQSCRPPASGFLRITSGPWAEIDGTMFIDTPVDTFFLYFQLIM